MRVLLLALFAFIAAFVASPHEARAQGDPASAIRIVLPVAPGPLDAFARTVAERLSDRLKRSVIVENRPGAGGNVAADLVAKSQPDGRTILLSFDTVVTVNPFLYPKLSFQPDELKPLAVLGIYGMMLAIHPDVQARNVPELVALSKQRPLRFASSGNGSPSHLALALLQKETGLDAIHVPYRGAGPAMTDLIGGHIDAFFTISTATNPPVKAGRLRALGYTGDSRSTLAPDVPTFAEAGMKNFNISFAYIAFVPAGTPDAITSPLFAALRETMAVADVREKIQQQDVTPVALSAAEAASWISQASIRWSAVVKQSRMTVD